jgi:hypothetical protein
VVTYKLASAKEAGDELELVPNNDDLVAVDEKGGCQQNSDNKFSLSHFCIFPHMSKVFCSYPLQPSLPTFS